MTKRWTVRIVGSGFEARCSICKRFTTSKADLDACPSGCHKSEERELAKKRKRAVKPATGRLF